MSAAADWLKTQGSEHSSFLLFVDEFDPHEPFDTEPWASQYGEWEGERLIWPPMLWAALNRDRSPERGATHPQQLRCQALDD